MSFFKRLGDLLSSSGKKETYEYWVAARCKRCGEVIRARVDLRNDLSQNTDEGEPVYYCRKMLVGEGDNLCFQRIEVELTFDKDRRLINREITGGEFVETEAEG